MESNDVRATLSPASIAAAGVRLADAEGLETVSMRRIAAELGVSAMALYRHVADREALLLQMARHAGSDFALLPSDQLDWRGMLEHMAAAEWRTFSQHPWLLQIVLGPHRLLNMATSDQLEALFGRLSAAGLPEQECFDVLLGVSAIVLGSACLALSSNPGPGAHRPTRPSAVVPLDPPAQLAPDSLTARFSARGVSYGAWHSSMEFTLRGFLAGVEQRLAGAAPGITRPDTTSPAERR